MDARQCEAEPIHIPGAIQPHGVLLALDPDDLAIAQVSANVGALLGVPAEALIGRALGEALGPELAGRVRAALAERMALAEQVAYPHDVPAPFAWRRQTDARAFVGQLHWSGDIPILELEQDPADAADTDGVLAPALRNFGALRGRPELPAKLAAAVALFRRLTGHDRVMVYRFDADWHGEVIAEDCRPDLEPYLGLHYPASDIPAQARQIFLVNPARVIPDVNYEPVALCPIGHPATGAPLDLSRSLLRSVSPVHLEYLRNMGVGATLTLSLVRDGRLWGLIACHHERPHAVSPRIREAACWMAQDLATQIALAEAMSDRRHAAHLKACRDRIIFAMRQGTRLPALVNGPELRQMLGAIGAEGVAFIRGDEIFTGGATPDPRAILEIAATLSAEHPNNPSQLFATDCLSEHLPGMAGQAAVAAGVALFPLDARQSIKLVWFRGEQVREVTWGGNPDKALDLADDGRPSPRRSFAAWRQIVGLRSRRWSREELESARKLGTLIDIEWRKMAEEALMRSEERLRQAAEEALRLSKESFRLAVDNMPDALVIYDERMRYRFLNTLSLRRGGQPLAAYLGRRDDEIYPPEICEVYLPHLRQTYATRTLTRFECTLTLPTGRYDLVVTYVPMLESGAVYQVFGFHYDITERKRSEAKLAEQARQLRQADWRKDEFLAMLAHELRNPLAPIANAVRIMQCPDSGARQDWCLAVIDRQTRHLTRLVDDLLDISRITRGLIELRMEPLELGEILARAIETSQPLIEARRHRLRTRMPAAGRRVRGDLVRLTQVVSNLLANAAKFTEDGGRIRLWTATDAQSVRIHVKDTGRGIDPDQLSRLFELFYQVDRTIARTEGGLGIGLSLVRHLVAMHGGTVEVRSQGLGRGSEFCVCLPRFDGPDDEGPDAVRPQRETPAAPGTGGGLRILVVDDNRDAIDSLELLLGGEGHEVLVAYDGESALRLALTGRPDLVLLDIGLPGMDGYAVARALRERCGPERPRILAITGYGQRESRERSRAAGCDLHLVKPIDFDALLGLLAACRGPKPLD